MNDVDFQLRAFPLPAELDTPALVVDLDRVEANVGRMQTVMDSRGVGLRPHAKTHKSVRFARMQLDVGAVGMTVAVLGEACVLAEAGINDVFVAYPVWPVGAKASRLRDLHDRVRVAVGVDSGAGAEQVAAAVVGARRPLAVLVEVDSGEQRTGQPHAEGALAVAQQARRAGLDVQGVFTHGGHAYRGHDLVAGAADDEVEVLEAAAAALRSDGFDVRVVSAGSTPTATGSARSPVTEQRPGTYIFGDRQQVHLGAHAPDAVALVAAATVVSTSARDGRFVVDAGAKTVAKDRPGWLSGHGAVPRYPGAVVEAVYDHHGVVRLPAGADGPSVGDVVAVVPNHVCPVVNLSDTITVVRSGVVVGEWPVDARGVRS